MQQSGQLRQLRRVFGDGGHGVDRQTGPVGGKQNPMTVHNRPARGTGANAASLIGGGGLFEVIPVNHLQKPQTAEEAKEEQGDDQPKPPRPLGGRPARLRALRRGLVAGRASGGSGRDDHRALVQA